MTTPEILGDAEPASLSAFDAIIDVRSPSEFAEDHIPGAINLPVLNDEERAKVGTIYVRQSRFLARKVGAALVARNVAQHLETRLADRDGSFRPLIYCWRGGQRSNSMAIILSQVGWRTSVLSGGYRTHRRRVQARLYGEALPLNLVLVDGGTGCAKTELVQRLARRGVQTLNLEEMARHRGSLFGRIEGQTQPSQKMFETLLLDAIERCDSSRPIVLEAESNKIGSRTLPPAVWSAMHTAPRLEVSAPIEARADYLVRVYDDIVRNPEALRRVLERLQTYPGRKRLAAWSELSEAGAYAELARQVIELHYDPAYAKSRRFDERPCMGAVSLPDLDPLSLATAEDQLVDLIRTRFGRI